MMAVTADRNPRQTLILWNEVQNVVPRVEAAYIRLLGVADDVNRPGLTTKERMKHIVDAIAVIIPEVAEELEDIYGRLDRVVNPE